MCIGSFIRPPWSGTARSSFNVEKYHARLNSSKSLDFQNYFYSNDLSVRVKKTWGNRKLIAIRNLFSDKFRLTELKSNFDRYRSNMGQAERSEHFDRNLASVENFTGSWPTDLRTDDDENVPGS